jgi:hypothetical protein
MLLKERKKERNDEEQEVGSYWMTLKKEEGLDRNLEKWLWKKLCTCHSTDYVMKIKAYLVERINYKASRYAVLYNRPL